MSQPIIVWFRQDLRLSDHPSLWHAAEKGVEVIPLYIYDERKMGTAQKVWLHHSLLSLMKQIPLVLRRGDPLVVLSQLQKETGGEIYANRCYEPEAIEIEQKLEGLKTFKANLLIEPWEVSPKTSSYFRVFTPFWKRSLQLIQPSAPLLVPKLKFYSKKIASDTLDEWHLLSEHPTLEKSIESYWKIGEQEAQERLEVFIRLSIRDYDRKRDRPDMDGTSQLSPYLHFGQISPRQLWCRLKGVQGAESYLRQLGWREFSYHLLYHFPTLPSDPFREKFSSFLWEDNEKLYTLWTKGETGYPIVDAGMRQLLKIGWMHNRVRMIVASFLTKDLLVPWQRGAAWFWERLVDADLANNSASWQWVAGCGADAAPYFRVFNPTLQGQKFDPEGDYIKEWVPELRGVDKKWIHKPWEMENNPYFPPIVDHKLAREEALKRYEGIK